MFFLFCFLTGIPDPPQSCLLRNVTAYEAMIYCLPGYLGGENLNFEVEKTGPFIQPGIANSRWSKEDDGVIVNVYKLTPNTIYSLRVYQSNTHGRSVSSYAVNLNTTGELINMFV